MRSRSTRRRGVASRSSSAGRHDAFRASVGARPGRCRWRRTIMNILSLLLFLHSGLFRAGLAITVIIGIWGLVTYFRKLPTSGGFRSSLVLTEILFILQGLVGVGMFLGGRRPHDPLH